MIGRHGLRRATQCGARRWMSAESPESMRVSQALIENAGRNDNVFVSTRYSMSPNQTVHPLGVMTEAERKADELYNAFHFGLMIALPVFFVAYPFFKQMKPFYQADAERAKERESMLREQ